MNLFHRIFFSVILCILFSSQLIALGNSAFTKIILKTDTSQYSYPDDKITLNNESYLPFFRQTETEVCEINVYPKNIQSSFQLLKSPDYDQLDSVVLINREYFRVKIKFTNLAASQFLSLTFQVKQSENELPTTEEVKLFPFTYTKVNFYPPSDELFIGEEKVFELLTNNPSNIKLTNEWVSGDGLNYRISEKNGQLRLHITPTSLGTKNFQLKLQTNAAHIDENKKVNYDLPVISYTFKVKTSRLSFLYLDKPEVTYDDNSRKNGIEVTLENNRNLYLHKTYRIENQEEAGGPLIAELYTKSFLANDKVLCILRTYNLHRQTEGYLYIKDNDDAKFITNFSITPKTSISGVYLMRNGQDWQQGNTVYPGETVDVKLEGEGLHKARFYWENVTDISSDTLTRSENASIFRLQIPMNINKRKIVLYNQTQNTGIALNLREYQIARPLDFLTINSGNGRKVILNNNTTIIQRNTIPDVTLQFDNSKIDNSSKIYGKQYVDVDIRLIGKRGELIEFKNLKNVVICPGENSPRAAYYNDNACNNSEISLNSLLSNKTYNLEDFAKIQLVFKNSADKYPETNTGKNVEIILQHPVVFDIDVSFPAGLMIQNLGKTTEEKTNLAKYDQSYGVYQLEYNAYKIQLEQWNQNPVGTKPVFGLTEPVKPQKAAFTDNLGGISLALIAQFSFPDAHKVGKLKPYRLGAGFLAINAFNFNENAKRDLAAVVLASLYPIKPGKVFNMPIHFGFGYKFQDKIPFLMLSPGIGIRF